MPTYVYACKNCGHRFEQYQSFSEDSLTSCPECTQAALRKVFDSVGIVFKGPGFYSTDSMSSVASSASSSSSADAPSTTPSTTSGASSGSSSPASSQPAAAAPAASTTAAP